MVAIVFGFENPTFLGKVTRKVLNVPVCGGWGAVEHKVLNFTNFFDAFPNQPVVTHKLLPEEPSRTGESRRRGAHQQQGFDVTQYKKQKTC